MLFDNFIEKNNFKNRATSNIKNFPAISSIALHNVDIYLRHGPFKSDIGIVNLHPSKGTHWVAFMNEKYFDSYGCSPPQKLFKFILTSKRDSFCSAPCLYTIVLTKVEGLKFKSTVLNLYYQMIQ